jgi:hypothetical protein
MMKKISLAMALLFCFSPAANSEEQEWKDTVTSPEGSYFVHVDERNQKIRVIPEKATKDSYPAIKIRILRKNDRPLDLRLRVLDHSQSPLQYAGKIGPESSSMIGLEMRVSFDRKTWKKIGAIFKKVAP